MYARFFSKTAIEAKSTHYCDVHVCPLLRCKSTLLRHKSLNNSLEKQFSQAILSGTTVLTHVD